MNKRIEAISGLHGTHALDHERRFLKGRPDEQKGRPDSQKTPFGRRWWERCVGAPLPHPHPLRRRPVPRANCCYWALWRFVRGPADYRGTSMQEVV